MPKEYDDSKTSVRNDNDWRNITDAAERRRAQNRIAQRNYRGFPTTILDLLPYNPISGHNVKLRQQELNQINESFTPRSSALTQRHALRLQSAALDTSTSSDLSASLNESMTTAQQPSTSLNTFWDDIIGTPSFLESAIDAEDFDGLSLVPSTQESAVATKNSREMDGLPLWTDIENFPTSTVSKNRQSAKILVNV